MVLRVWQIHDSAGCSTEPDDTFTDPQFGATDRLRVQPLGRRKFEDIARALHVDRAHLAYQFRADQTREHRQRGCTVCPQVSQPGQQSAGTRHRRRMVLVCRLPRIAITAPVPCRNMIAPSGTFECVKHAG